MQNLRALRATMRSRFRISLHKCSPSTIDLIIQRGPDASCARVELPLGHPGSAAPRLAGYNFVFFHSGSVIVTVQLLHSRMRYPSWDLKWPHRASGGVASSYYVIRAHLWRGVRSASVRTASSVAILAQAVLAQRRRGIHARCPPRAAGCRERNAAHRTWGRQRRAS